LKQKTLTCITCLLLVLATLPFMLACPAPPSSPPTTPAQTTPAQTTPAQTTPESPQERYERIKAHFDNVIVPAAKKEGKVVVYNDIVGHESKTFQDAWKAAGYGDIKIECVLGRFADLYARAEVEQVTKKYVGDLWPNPATSTWTLKSDGFTVQYNPKDVLPTLNDPSVKWFSPPYIDPDGYYFADATDSALYGIIVNTDLVPPDKYPKSWMDLATDPYWKGKMLQNHPASLRIGGWWTLIMHQMYGDEYLDKVAAQDPIVTTEGAGEQALYVCRGEYALTFPGRGDTVMLMPPGTPCKLLFPDEGVFAVTTYNSLLNGAPHPNAALVLMEFLMSQEAQRSYVEVGRTVFRVGVPTLYPEQDLTGKKIIPLFEEGWFLENSNRLFEEAAKRYDL